jgi:hypothetical protein
MLSESMHGNSIASHAKAFCNCFGWKGEHIGAQTRLASRKTGGQHGNPRNSQSLAMRLTRISGCDASHGNEIFQPQRVEYELSRTNLEYDPKRPICRLARRAPFHNSHRPTSWSTSDGQV